MSEALPAAVFPVSQSSGSFQREALLVDARLVPRSVVGRHGEADVRRTVDRVVAAPQPAAGVLHRQSERRTAAVDIGGGVVGQQGQSVAPSRSARSAQWSRMSCLMLSHVEKRVSFRRLLQTSNGASL